MKGKIPSRCINSENLGNSPAGAARPGMNDAFNRREKMCFFWNINKRRGAERSLEAHKPRAPPHV